MVNINKIPTKPIVLGRIGSCYGIHGWIRVLPFTEKAESIFDYLPWFILEFGLWKKLKLEGWRYHNRNIIIKLKTANSRDTASFLAGREIVINSSQLPKLDRGNYYWKDLIGCQVVTIEGYNLGKVISMIETKSNNILVVKANAKDALGIEERLVPFLDEKVIKKVELSIQTIEVDWDPYF